MRIYTRKEIDQDLFLVLGADGEALKNHNGKPYPHLSGNISWNLIEDLNQIAKSNYQFYEASLKEANSHKLVEMDSGEELRQSFGYCLLSNLIEYQEAEMCVDYDFDMQIQWDRLFRMNILPNGGMLEQSATRKARDFFEGKWRNFGYNYCQSIKEMDEKGVEMVTEDIITEIKALLNTLQFSHKIAVDILYEFFDCFSITIPILWVNGKIRDKDFIGSYWALYYGIDINKTDEEEYEHARFLMNRLLYFKTILRGYLWKDKSLPCVDYG